MREAAGSSTDTAERPVLRPDPRVREPIRIARVICIFAMFYVHVNPGLADFDPASNGVRLFDGFRLELTNSLGRASIALLSVISGYLGVISLVKAGYLDFARKKVRSLLVPLVIWSGLVIALAWLGDKVQPGYLEETLRGPLELSRLPTLLLGVFGNPANLPLSFLRDIFVCALLAPLLIAAFQTGWRMFLLVTVALYVVGHFTLLFITPNLLAFFAIGVAIAQSGKLPQIPAIAGWISAALVFLLGAWVSYLQVGFLRSGVTEAPVILEVWLTLIRFPAAVLFWWVSVELAKTRFGRRVASYEPFIFFAFCSHLLILTVLWFGWQQVFGGYNDAAYPVFFLLSPPVMLALSALGAWMLHSILPPVFSVMNGGRGLRAQHRAPSTAPQS